MFFKYLKNLHFPEECALCVRVQLANDQGNENAPARTPLSMFYMLEKDEGNICPFIDLNRDT